MRQGIAGSIAKLALVVCAALGSAQAAVTITGRVADENGAPVRDVRVTVSGGATSIGATSDAAGVFRLEVPEDGNYRVEAQSDGYFLFAEPSVALSEAAPLEIRLNRLKDLAESVDVHYSPPVIDPQQTSDTKKLNNQEILNIPYPASQDYRSALPLMPGVVSDNSGQIHFSGGNTNETSYRLDGFEVSDPSTGALNTRMNVDTVQAIEWNASRFGPDQGKGSAGTVDIKTEMGDDRWRFGGTNFIPGFGTQDGFHLNHWSPRVKVSGPLRKGRIWFENSFDTFYSVAIVPGLPKGGNQTTGASGTDLTRLQWNIGNADILTASFLLNLEDDTRTGLSIFDPAETTVNRRVSLFLGTVKDQWMVGGGLVEFGFADSAGYRRLSPQGDAPYVITPFGSSGNYFADQTAWTSRQEWLVNGFVRPVAWHGTHQFRVGTDVQRSGLDQTILRHDYESVRVDNSLIRDVQFLGSPRQFTHNVEAWGYLLDRWNPAKSLSLEAGVRTQWDEYTGGAPAAPRLAAAWSPAWAGGARFSAGWGVFYDAVTLNMLALSQEQDSISTFYSPDGTVVGGPILTRFELATRDLRLPRFALTSFSADRKLPWQIYGKLNLLSRQGSRGFTFEDSVVSPTLNLYILDNIQRQRYRSAEVSLRRTFLARYQWFASYTRSEARANAVIDYSVENPLFTPQAGGPLLWDAPNHFLTWGWAPLEKNWFPGFLAKIVGETDLQVLFDYRTGFPFSVTNETGNIVGPPDSMRFPDYATLNVAIERRFPFRGYLWAWRVGWINALNRANPNQVNTDIDSPQYLTYARGQARAVNVRLRFLGRK
ncbi:MAG TPA: TonB-dependent receptor [Bryobacteraceae bacterium]|nr:TonB-dependent receptor [Bryobacteraceae bacterium]